MTRADRQWAFGIHQPPGQFSHNARLRKRHNLTDGQQRAVAKRCLAADAATLNQGGGNAFTLQSKRAGYADDAATDYGDFSQLTHPRLP